MNKKRKLANAKEKLRDLQDFIEKLEVLARGVSNTNELIKTEPKQRKQQYDEEANELENQSRIQEELKRNLDLTQKKLRLNELERNKQHFLDLLREKEAELNRLGEKEDGELPADATATVAVASAVSMTGSMGEIESKFKTAENDFECLSLDGNDDNDPINGECRFTSMMTKSRDSNKGSNNKIQHHSPSDLLWSQMKRQLNMRESMRSKKKELEDLIRDEYQISPLPMQVDTYYKKLKIN